MDQLCGICSRPTWIQFSKGILSLEQTASGSCRNRCGTSTIQSNDGVPRRLVTETRSAEALLCQHGSSIHARMNSISQLAPLSQSQIHYLNLKLLLNRVLSTVRKRACEAGFGGKRVHNARAHKLPVDELSHFLLAFLHAGDLG